MISKVTEYTVYESPDGGETVYMRKSGETSRELYGISDLAHDKLAMIRENTLWHNIRLAAKTNPSLQALLDQCIMVYNLSKESDKDV